METETTNNKRSLWIIVSVIIIIGVLFLIFKPTQQADAPTADQSDTATTTATEADGVSDGIDDGQFIDFDRLNEEGEQTIEGDGYVATVRPVISDFEPTGEAPEIVRFTVQTEAGAACKFSWEVTKAIECNFINTETRAGIKTLPLTGNLQIGNPGTYQLECIGSGGKVTMSEVLLCS